MLHHKISIVIVAYNQEQFIEQTLASIESQTIGIELIEVILVNDSSTDNTGKFFQAFQGKYPDHVRIVTVHNLNVGKTRNDALKLVSSPYLIFLDGDDLLADNACETLLKTACQQKSCMIISPLNEFSNEKELICNDLKINNVMVHSISAQLLFQEFLTGKTYHGNIGGVLFSRSLFEHIHFPEFTCYEDCYIAPDLIFQAQHLYLIDCPIYNYRKNIISTSSSLTNVKAAYRLQTVNKVKNFLKNGLEKHHYYGYCIKHCQVIMDHVKSLSPENKQQIKEIILGIPFWHFIFSCSNRLSRKKILWKKRKEVLRWEQSNEL